MLHKASIQQVIGLVELGSVGPVAAVALVAISVLHSAT